MSGVRAVALGVCPRCGQAFAFTPEEASDPITLECGTYLEGLCVWCDVRAIVPEREVFRLTEFESRGEGEAQPVPRHPRRDH